MISAMADDLHSLKDDMNAFIMGHGLLRFDAYIGDDMNSVLWDATASKPDAWKDFIELAKACDVKFVTYNEDILEKEDLDFLTERLQNSASLDDELDEARFLRGHVGKVGFIQLGFPYQGNMFLYEVSADWYDRYQALLDSADDFTNIIFDERDQRDDDER
jgi:hypothetical protein